MATKLNLLFIATMFAAFTITSCKKEESASDVPQTTATPDISEKGINPDEAVLADEDARHHHEGFLYTESNSAGINHILCFKQHGDGSLTHESTVASGGHGAGAGLGSQGALALDNHHHLLFAVNAGSNNISAFEVHNDGSLTRTHTEMSGGTMPVSLCVYHNILYVVNAGSSNINGYTFSSNGMLTHIMGSNLPLSSVNAGPAQIGFSPNGEYLYVTEKMTNKIISYDVDMNGLATYDTTFNTTGNTPFGFSIARDRFMIVSNADGGMPSASSCTSYSGINPGTLNAVNGAVANNQTAACWVATTRYGRFAYVSNTGSNSISSYYVAPWGGLYLIHASAVTTGSHPIDLCVSAGNYYVYNLNEMSHSISGYHRAFLGDLVHNGVTTGLPDYAAGLVAM